MESFQNKLLMSAVEALFNIPPLFEAATKSARKKIVQRGEALGDNWGATLSTLREIDWSTPLSSTTNPSVQYPEYYTQPFHAYKEGNLSLDAAFEVTLAAKSVHASVMDPSGKVMDPKGDLMLRSTYGERMKELMQAAGFDGDTRNVLDMGCATGLSSVALMEQFPGSLVTGVDLSPYFLAVGRYQQQQREAESGTREPLDLVHAAAEATGQASGSFDLVSVCLVFHELPISAAKDILAEAFRVLRPGGALAIMEMNPKSPVWQRVFGNPIAFAAFKSTEPWLQEYLQLDLHQAIRDVGFSWVGERENTPRHRTVVALKPQ